MELELVTLLRAVWLSTTLPVLIASLPSSSMSSFYGFVMLVAKRGKITDSSTQKFTVPQSFFLHFYILAVAWTTILLVITWIYAYKMAPLVSEESSQDRIWSSVFLLLLLEVQVVRRLIESLYVFNYSPTARLHILGYVIGFLFYVLAPPSLCCNYAPEIYKFAANQAAEFVHKRGIDILAVDFHLWEFVRPLLKLGLYHYIGAVIFLWGWAHQRRCHAILGSLRDNKKAGEYVIPHGDWFELVSSPHYLAEIVLYIGIVIAGGATDPTLWMLLGFVVTNLAFAAGETHRWYLRKFEDYPRSRKALIPLVY